MLAVGSSGRSSQPQDLVARCRTLSLRFEPFRWPQRFVKWAAVLIQKAADLKDHLDDQSSLKRDMVMGDLVLLESEINPVMLKLIEGGLQITAVHNHLLRASPSTFYMPSIDCAARIHLRNPRRRHAVRRNLSAEAPSNRAACSRP